MFKNRTSPFVAFLYLQPLFLAFFAVGIAFREPIAPPDTPVFRGIPVEVWAFESILLMPIITVLWLQLLTRRRLVWLSDPRVREEMALTRMTPREFLSGRLLLPFLAGVVPFIVTFSFLACRLRFIAVRTMLLLESGPEPGMGHLLYEETYVRLIPFSPPYLGFGNPRKYGWPDLAFLFPLGLCVVFIWTAGHYASLARLCRRPARVLYSWVFGGAWLFFALILPHVSAFILNLASEPRLQPWHPKYWLVSPHVALFAIAPTCRTFIWLLAVASAAYAYFWWRRLCTVYYRFE